LSATDWFEKGKVFIISRNFSEAINAMTNAIQLDPKNEWAYLNRGLAYRGLNAYQESLNDYNKVIEMDLDVIVEISAYSMRASAYEALGKYQNAIDDMTKVIERSPKDPIYYVGRGRLYKKAGNNQEAENDFNAFALKPKGASANLSLAFAYVELGNYEQAINSCDKTIALDPKNIWAYYLRAYSYDKLGNTDRAIKEYDRTIELDPNNSTAYHGRGNIYRKLGYYERALIEYNKGIIINPRNIHLMCDIARLYALKNDSIKACEWLRESIENLN
jgi:tetratricopeptide (TPR) repeat protein